MVLTVELKNVTDLTGAERRSCHAMSYQWGGDISPWLHEASGTEPTEWPTGYEKGRNGKTAKVVLVKEDSKIIGWAFRWDKTGAAGYWTRVSHRGHGIGTMMVEETLKLGKISTHPHDYPSAKLFVKTSALPKGSVRTWKKHSKEVEQGNIAYCG